MSFWTDISGALGKQAYYSMDQWVADGGAPADFYFGAELAPAAAATPAPVQAGFTTGQYENLKAMGFDDATILSNLDAYLAKTGNTRADVSNFGDQAVRRVMGMQADPGLEAQQQNQIAADTQRLQAGNSMSNAEYMDLLKGVGMVVGAGSIGNAFGGFGGAGAGASSGVPDWMQGYNTYADNAARGLGTQVAGETGSAGLGAVPDYGGAGGVGNNMDLFKGSYDTGVDQINPQTGGGGFNLSKYLTPQVLGAGISTLGGLAGAGMQANAARNAAQQVADANRSSNSLLALINEQNRARTEPFYQAGLSALPSYARGVMPGGDLVRPFAMTDYQADPGYGFRLSEGMKALERSAASRGNLLSGSTLKGAQQFGQGLASQEYQNAYNRYGTDQATRRNALAGLTGFAPTAAATMAAGNTNYGTAATGLASDTASTMANAGLTRASAYGNALAGAGNAFSNAVSPNPMNQLMAALLAKQTGVS